MREEVEERESAVDKLERETLVAVGGERRREEAATPPTAAIGGDDEEKESRWAIGFSR